ncbi:MAG: NAD(P)/FAD-dependent oxidoreductase [Mycoplasma sp.]
MNILIIGGGVASVVAIETIRNLNQDAQITLISKENVLPYNRIMISDVIGDLKVAESDIFYLHNQAWYDEKKVNVHLGLTVTSIDPNAKKVLTSSETFNYDKLIIATGVLVAKENYPGEDAKHIYMTRNFEDANVIQEIYKKNFKTALIHGAGETGIEVASSLGEHGIKITLLEYMSRPLVNNFSEQFLPVIIEDLKKKNVEFVTEVRIKEVVKNNRGEFKKLILQDGRKLEADCMLVSSRTVPNVDLFKNTDLKIGSNGIIVNEKMQTNLPDIYAIGDVANIENKPLRKLWAEARLHGKIAGSHICGKDESYISLTLPIMTYIFGSNITIVGRYQNKNDKSKEFILPTINNGYHLIFDENDNVIYGLACNNQKLSQALITKKVNINDYKK